MIENNERKGKKQQHPKKEKGLENFSKLRSKDQGSSHHD